MAPSCFANHTSPGGTVKSRRSPSLANPAGATELFVDSHERLALYVRDAAADSFAEIQGNSGRQPNRRSAPNLSWPVSTRMCGQLQEFGEILLPNCGNRMCSVPARL